MNAFSKAVFLALAASSVVSASDRSVRAVDGGAALRSQVQAARGDRCAPNERPRPTRRNSSRTRFRFNLLKSDASCRDADDLSYEYGTFNDVRDSDECAEMCVNDTPARLANVLRGFNYDCSGERCRCLYDEGTLDERRPFDSSNYRTRNRKGRGSIKKTERNRGSYCFKLVGAELEGEDFELYHEMHALLAAGGITDEVVAEEGNPAGELLWADGEGRDPSYSN